MAHNLAQCQKLVSKAVAAGAKALFLPEASDYIASSATESVSLCQDASKSPFVRGLQQAARENSLPINVGIHEPTEPPSKRIRNTLIWIDKEGDIVHRYQKLHVFDIDLRPDGPRLKESDSTEPGHEIEPPYPSALGKIGSLICFDLRFPEPALRLRRLGAEVLVYPSAFTVPTGKLHWEILLRARAIESQSWVIAAAQCGRHNEKRVSYGDAIVMTPNGQVAGRLDHVDNIENEKENGREPDLFTVDIDLESVKTVRKGIPLLRRTDVYPEIFPENILNLLREEFFEHRRAEIKKVHKYTKNLDLCDCEIVANQIIRDDKLVDEKGRDMVWPTKSLDWERDIVVAGAKVETAIELAEDLARKAERGRRKAENAGREAEEAVKEMRQILQKDFTA
ncbi:Carbon-nitrogen hydrolase [Elasticomyces elasticus]|nr:Carbon-nitrogen hydrolase [Elasticomyces elasticus]KAK5034976.1 Carbon-nitrogen hydrolase [Exophiala sideris]KAK5181221.1 Carbon-nitrogen hydrolase [Eurotiomycetes sp. CCFEE 6388]